MPLESMQYDPSVPSRPAHAPDPRVEEHLGLVYHLAHQLCRSRQLDVEVDELVSAGTLGLLEALRNFDATRGLAFSTFAAPRIRGAMLDELRRQDHVPRSVRRRARDVRAATDALAHELGAAPTQQQVAERMGVDLENFARWQDDVDAARVLPLEQTTEGSPSGSLIPSDTLISSVEPDIEDALTHEQEMALLQAAIRALPKVERTVLTLYYFEELKLQDVASLLGVSESRVSQIRSKAVGRLRKALAAVRDPVEPTARPRLRRVSGGA